ncbi:hypothetical protein [Aestuariivirga sp.]
MNWILDTYSNVYSTAMLQPHEPKANAAPAKERVHVKRPALFGLFGRR